MNVTIKPSVGRGEITAPPSKSLAHRYIICALLSNGVSRLTNIDFSEDIKATLDCIKALGAHVDIDNDQVIIESKGPEGICDYLSNIDKPVEFMCRESGSTMRFFMGVAMVLGCPAYFYGSETLRNRPFGIYETIAENNGIEFSKEEDRIYVNGKLRSGDYKIPGNISSQFITGLLFALPILDGNSSIELTGSVESRSYINLTFQSLRFFGVKISWKGDNIIEIDGNQSYEPRQIGVEGDCSNAAFLEAFNTCNGCVNVLGVNSDTLQGDYVYSQYFEKLVEGHATLDISDCPDLGPILFAVAAANKGGIFTGTKRLKIKESDRGSVMCEVLSKFGIKTRLEENEIEVYEGSLHKPDETLSGYNDHRIVMSEAYLMTITGGSINGASAVRKSYPGFFEDIKQLGIEVIKDGMD